VARIHHGARLRQNIVAQSGAPCLTRTGKQQDGHANSKEPYFHGLGTDRRSCDLCGAVGETDRIRWRMAHRPGYLIPLRDEALLGVQFAAVEAHVVMVGPAHLKSTAMISRS
jgi:hypothetical protein